MGTLPSASLLAILDSVAAAKAKFDASMGLLGTETGTVSKAATNDLTTLTAVADNDVQADLAAVFRARATGIRAASLYGVLGAYNVWWALDKHLGGLDQFMQANNLRAHEDVKTLGFPLSPEQILPPQVDPLATFAVTGSGVGTFEQVDSVDASQYGRAWLQVVVTATIGAAPIDATINGLQWDQTTPVNKTVTISAASSVGTTVNVGTLGVQADSYNVVSGITITGGTSGDAFKVISRVERTIGPIV